ncbi:MAG: SgcJ/EcaC family oxidoreductase [Sneathiella sp.]|uniref:YybH family protein n=1 Tax=Sneathiella sp. TaxID=1964365 RepID=UPI003002CFDC
MSASEIAAVNQKFSACVANADLDSLMVLYTEDACFIASNSDFLRGRDEIRGFFQAVLDMGIKEIRLSTNEVDLQGDTAIEVGTYELMADGGVQADHGKFLVVWKKTGGEWQLHRDMINTSMPAPE